MTDPAFTHLISAMCRHDITLLSQQKALVLWGVLGNIPLLHYNTSQLLNPLHSQSALKVFMWKDGERCYILDINELQKNK